MAKHFRDLSDAEILALAITLDDDGRVHADFADGLRQTCPATAAMFEDTQREPRHAVTMQLVVGGTLVFPAGLLIGSA